MKTNFLKAWELTIYWQFLNFCGLELYNFLINRALFLFCKRFFKKANQLTKFSASLFGNASKTYFLPV